MENLRCECGQENPFGTKLCAKCGRPLTKDEQEQKFADMRYDGTAIRSKTYNKSIIDKVWNFFSSVKVGISLIIINLIAASLGTILPQEFFVSAGTAAEKAAYYEQMYGSLGKLYYNLGLSNTYSSWWFQILVGLLGISIIIASIDRGIPLHKSLKNQRVKRHASFMKRQRVVAEGPSSVEGQDTLQLVEEALKKQKYNVRREGNSILGERGRFARYGPYINHLGLIIFLVGVMLRLIPGFYTDTSFWLYEGEVRAVPGMEGYYIENKRFILETYDNEAQGEQLKQGVNTIAKNFQTDVILYKAKEGSIPGQDADLEVVKEYDIRVNFPLKHDGFAFYQMDYNLNELKTMKFKLAHKETGTELGDVSVDLINPQDSYVIDENTRVELVSYYPDFSGFIDGVPQTATQYPNNPAFIFRMFTPQTPEGETSFVAIQQTLEPLGENAYKMAFNGIETRSKSGLAVHNNKAIPMLFVGGIIFMFGIVIGAYFNHRRVWLELLEDGSIRYAAHTNKNWSTIKKDLDAIVAHAHLPHYVDRQDEEVAQNQGQEKEGDNAL